MRRILVTGFENASSKFLRHRLRPQLLVLRLIRALPHLWDWSLEPDYAFEVIPIFAHIEKESTSL